VDSGSHQTIKTVKQRLFRNASWLFGGKTVAGGFSALQTVVLARILGVDDYGLLALIIAYVDILNNFFDFRVWETATKYIGAFWTNGDREKTLSFIKLSYIIDITSGILAFIIAIVTAKIASSYLIHSPNAYTLIWIYSLSLLIDTANSTSDAILRVFDRFKRIAFISSFISLFRLILVILLLYLGMRINGVLFSFVLASFLGFSIRIWIVSKTLRENQLTNWWKSDLSVVKRPMERDRLVYGKHQLCGNAYDGKREFHGCIIFRVLFWKRSRSILQDCKVFCETHNTHYGSNL